MVLLGGGGVSWGRGVRLGKPVLLGGVGGFKAFGKGRLAPKGEDEKVGDELGLGLGIGKSRGLGMGR